MEKEKNEALTAELSFLLQQFLSILPLKKTLQVFNEELEENKIIPKCIDRKSNGYDSTVQAMINLYPNMRPHHLLQFYNQIINKAGLALPNKSLFSILGIRRNTEGFNKTNIKQYSSYVTKRLGATIEDVVESYNIINLIRGTEVSGPLSRRRIMPSWTYSAMRIQRKVKGHPSPVYCLIFDHSGKYIITGSEDRLVKLWIARTGMLKATFAGALGPITDLSIDSFNTLLAAGSLDGIVYVWNLQTGSLVACGLYYTKGVMKVDFYPKPLDGYWYIGISDASGFARYWPYTYDLDGNSYFCPNMTSSVEADKIDGGSFLCSPFSPGGSFLARSTVNNCVTMCYIKKDFTLSAILRAQVHTDFVNHIEWAHSRLRFLSAGGDGIVMVWSFERQQWRAVKLASTTDTTKAKIMIACWSKYDDYISATGSNFGLNVWRVADTHLEKVLMGHTNTINLLRAHPHENNVIVSSGYDKKIIIWDIKKGLILCQYTHLIQQVHYAGILNLIWSPDGYVLAASDQEGQFLIFGLENSSSHLDKPSRPFLFDKDYRSCGVESNSSLGDLLIGQIRSQWISHLSADTDHIPNLAEIQRLFLDYENYTGMSISDFLRLEFNEHLKILRNFIETCRSKPPVKALVEPLKKSVVDRANEVRKCMEEAELAQFRSN